MRRWARRRRRWTWTLACQSSTGRSRTPRSIDSFRARHQTHRRRSRQAGRTGRFSAPRGVRVRVFTRKLRERMGRRKTIEREKREKTLIRVLLRRHAFTFVWTGVLFAIAQGAIFAGPLLLRDCERHRVQKFLRRKRTASTRRTIRRRRVLDDE